MLLHSVISSCTLYTHNLQLNYIEVDVTASHQTPKSASQQQPRDPGSVEYSVVTPKEPSVL